MATSYLRQISGESASGLPVLRPARMPGGVPGQAAAEATSGPPATLVARPVQSVATPDARAISRPVASHLETRTERSRLTPASPPERRAGPPTGVSSISQAIEAPRPVVSQEDRAAPPALAPRPPIATRRQPARSVETDALHTLALVGRWTATAPTPVRSPTSTPEEAPRPERRDVTAPPTVRTMTHVTTAADAGSAVAAAPRVAPDAQPPRRSVSIGAIEVRVTPPEPQQRPRRRAATPITPPPMLSRGYAGVGLGQG